MSTVTAVPPVAAKARSKPLLTALAGVPNAGKTTLFNALTGLNYKVANYPGVTVEKRVGTCHLAGFENIQLVDLPGAYSLFGGSPDEVLAADHLMGRLPKEDKPDVVICVVDACNIERNLFLASQIIDIGIPVVVALNMLDIAKTRGLSVRKELLAKNLGVAVVDISGRTKTNTDELLRAVAKAGSGEKRPGRYRWCSDKEFLDSAKSIGRLSRSDDTDDPDELIGIGIGLLSGSRQAESTKQRELLLAMRKQLVEQGVDAGAYETEERYCWVNGIASRSVAQADGARKDLTEKLDRVLTHPVWGLLIFLMIMGTMFQSIFTWASIPMDFIDSLFADVQVGLKSIIPPGQLQSLIADGIVVGVGSVLIFIPQIAVLYLFISVLEETGYLSRAAVLLDAFMRRVGLQGRSFIPLLSSFACAIPGIMATRSIPSFSDRMATILIAPLMSCSARLPVYTLLIAAFVPRRTVAGFLSLQGLVFLGLYLLGIVGALAIAYLLRKTVFRSSPSHFLMEMPPYRIPVAGQVLKTIWEKCAVFVKNAGTVILACSILLWFLASYPKTTDGSPSEAVRQSYAGQLGQAIEPIIEPLGYDWKLGVSIIASFAAREVFVSSVALVNNLEDVDEESDSLIDAIRNAKDPETGEHSYDLATALSLMVFFVFACQCMSTLAVCKRETGGWKWPIVMFVYMTALAYGAAFVTFRLSSSLLT